MTASGCTLFSRRTGGPAGAGTAAGAGFAVRGLTLQRADLDGPAGEIHSPVVQAGGVGRLSESVADARWGMPRDVPDGVDNDADGLVVRAARGRAAGDDRVGGGRGGRARHG